MLARGAAACTWQLNSGMAPQRVAAVMTDNPMLGVRSWTSVLPRNPAPGKDEALCLWLNSTFGLLLRIMHGNRPYLGRSAVPHELARTMPVLDVEALSAGQLRGRSRRLRRPEAPRASGLQRAGRRSRPARAQRTPLPRGARHRSRGCGRHHPPAGPGADAARAALRGGHAGGGGHLRRGCNAGGRGTTGDRPIPASPLCSALAGMATFVVHGGWPGKLAGKGAAAPAGMAPRGSHHDRHP